ncbi:MAG: electron transport complex subunit RsxC [Bacteroidales bacterium]|nr:electron transport complex subunit RsxC [Bacteroidales bacterium]
MLKTFKLGGVHPEENKLSAGSAIEVLELPKTAYIPISQVLGAPSNPVVEKGAKVKVGQLIAKGEAFISANVHSSVSGTVSKIDDITDASGYRRKTIIIDVEGDEWDENIIKTDEIIREIKLSSEEIIKKISEMGIVGLGGATFPTYVKLKIPEGKKADVLIINGVECEPYLTSDHRLMLEKSEEMLTGITILMKALNVNRAVIGIENNKADAIGHLQNLINKNNTYYKGIEVCPLKVKYPQGGEKQLIKAITDREVPSGKLPIDVNAVVQNVGTAFAVYEAVQKNKPLFERVVTITGKNLSRPSNFLVRIGTPVKELIEKAGGLPSDTGKVISGGPMMGKALNSLDSPVVKGTSGLVVMKTDESPRLKTVNCIRCGKCVSVCPMGLEPYYLAVVAAKELYEEAEKHSVMDCIECGSCMFTCPSGRPLLDYLRVGKNKVGQIIRNRSKN